MSMLSRIRKGAVCPICGKPDWCGDRDDSTFGHIWLCHRYTGGVDHVATVTKHYGSRKEGRDYVTEYPIVVGTDGQWYVVLPDKKGSGCTNFYLYEELERRVSEQLTKFEEENKARAEEKGYKYHPSSSFEIDGSAKDVARVSESLPRKIVEWKMADDIVQPLSHDVLDGVLRAWLHTMQLSSYHKKKLLLEWDTSDKPGIGKMFSLDRCLNTYLLRTLPPEDWERKAAVPYYKACFGSADFGPTREELIEKLLRICKEHGLESPAGIPGIYYDKERSKWRILSRAGILFPVYDADGKMYRLRLGTDTPECIGVYDDMAGTYRFRKGIWEFQPDRGGPAQAVWQDGKGVALSGKGLPKGAKANGKYVNVSSYSEVRDEETHTIRNRFQFGSQCGGCVSLYLPQDGVNKKVCWVTEGEKKAMVMSLVMGVPVVCLPGVSSFSKLFEPIEEGKPSTADRLKEIGVQCVVVAFDADKDTNAAVKSAEDKLLKALHDHGVKKLAKTEWHAEFGKGLDDALLDGAMPDLVMVTY